MENQRDEGSNEPNNANTGCKKTSFMYRTNNKQVVSRQNATIARSSVSTEEEDELLEFHHKIYSAVESQISASKLIKREETNADWDGEDANLDELIAETEKEFCRLVQHTYDPIISVAVTTMLYMWTRRREENRTYAAKRSAARWKEIISLDRDRKDNNLGSTYSYSTGTSSNRSSREREGSQEEGPEPKRAKTTDATLSDQQMADEHPEGLSSGTSTDLKGGVS